MLGPNPWISIRGTDRSRIHFHQHLCILPDSPTRGQEHGGCVPVALSPRGHLEEQWMVLVNHHLHLFSFHAFPKNTTSGHYAFKSLSVYEERALGREGLAKGPKGNCLQRSGELRAIHTLHCIHIQSM